MKFLKQYWVMLICILFFFLYGVLFGCMFYSDKLFYNVSAGIIILLITVLLVLAIYGLIVWFIIHAANNKNLKHKVWWCIGIYYLNVFIMPYYYLRHICLVKDTKMAMVLYIFICILVFAIGGLVALV